MKFSARASSLYVQTIPKDYRIIGRFSYCCQHGEGIVNPTCCLCYAALNLIPLFITVILLFMVLGCFAITNVRTTTVQASSRTFKSNGRTYMEKHNDNTLNTVLYQKISGRYKQVAKSSTYLIYRFSYGKKLYFSSADDETSDIPWVIFEHFLGM